MITRCVHERGEDPPPSSDSITTSPAAFRPTWASPATNEAPTSTARAIHIAIANRIFINWFFRWNSDAIAISTGIY